MKIFFCEVCGKRLTDMDIEIGKAIDKQLAGIYCRECGVGVATRQEVSVGSKPNKGAHESARTTPSHTNRLSRPGLPTAGHAKASARVQGEAGAPVGLYAGLGLGALVLAVVVLVTSGGKAKPPAAGAVAAPQTRASAAEPAAQPALGKAPAPRPAVPDRRVERVAPLTTNPEEKLARQREDAAQDALDKLTKFENLPASDTAGRIKALEDFDKEYNDTLPAARARSMIQKLKNPEPATASGAPAQGNDMAEATACYQRGLEKDRIRDFAGALAEFDRCLQLALASAETHNAKASVMIHMSDLEGALTEVERGLALKENLFELHANKALALFGLGRDGEAKTALARACRLHSQPAAVTAQIEKLGLQTKALWRGKQLESQQPASAQDFVLRGAHRFRDRRFDDALKDYEEALKTDAAQGPQGVFLGMAEIAKAKKDWKARLEYYRRWIAADGQSIDALNGFAWELLTCEDQQWCDAKAALPLAEKASELALHKNPAVLDTLALARFHNGKITEAIETQKQAIALLPANYTAEQRKEYIERLAKFEATK